jgi:hypothetical protein
MNCVLGRCLWIVRRVTFLHDSSVHITPPGAIKSRSQFQVARSAAVLQPAVRNSDGLVHLAGYVLHLRPTFWPNIFLIESSVIRATASADGGKKQRESSRLEGKHTPTQYRSRLRRQEERILKAKSDSSASREDG